MNDRDTVQEAVRSLKGLTIGELRIRWRSLGGAPPRLQSGELVRRLLAERIQQDAFGRDPELERRLNALVAAWRRGRPPPVRRAAFKPGTMLIREYAGVTHRVEVLEKGFLWEAREYGSLSEIARQITGTR